MITLTNYKSKMIEKAKEQGISENFGQKEIQQLKDKYGYNPFGTPLEQKIVDDINELENWVICLDYQHPALK